MKTTLKNQGLWDVVKNGIPPDPSKNPDLAATLQFKELCKWRDLVREDMKALEILQSALTESVFRKTLSATSAKELWDTLKLAPDVSFDANMWTISTNTANHMTPHEMYFITLDRKRRAKVTFINGTTVLAQGIGDVRVLTKEGKKETIKDVLFVPEIVTNVLSVGQLNKSGYTVTMGTELMSIRERATGTLFGESRWDEKRGFFLRFEVV